MGPLAGLKVVEFAGIGPAPMCAMLLSDLGATVLRLERPGGSELGVGRPLRFDLLRRGRPAISVDLKHPLGPQFALELIEKAEILIEGYRPGVMERMGLGPEPCLARNPALVYGRMTGWGQDGPLAHTAGHDLNYIAIIGALDAIGRKGSAPTPPLNLVGDFGGGALYLAFGLLAALTAARSSGQGQVVDAAMIDGAASLLTSFFGLDAAGLHNRERGTNILDSGAPFYDVNLCADGRYVAVAAIEMKFRRELFERLNLPGDLPDGQDPADWPVLKDRLAATFKMKSQLEWTAIFDGSDACVSPVLSMSEAATHPHNAARRTLIEIDGVVQPAPAPRFSRTPPPAPVPPSATDTDIAQAMSSFGFSHSRLDEWMRRGVLAQARSV